MPEQCSDRVIYHCLYAKFKKQQKIIAENCAPGLCCRPASGKNSRASSSSLFIWWQNEIVVVSSDIGFASV